MSTELGEVKDCLDNRMIIEVALGMGGIHLFSTEKKIWLDKKGVERLIELLRLAIERRD